MSVENSEILRAVTDLTSKVETYHGDFREFRGTQVAKVKALEDTAKSDKLWQNVKVICVIPVVSGLHQIAQHLGWIK